jgi:ATP-dependent helicase/DNAse subunit B
MDVNTRINSMMESFTDNHIKNLIREHNQLDNTGVLPPDSEYRLLSKTICELYGIPFNLKMGETWLQTEVFKRFLAKS